MDRSESITQLATALAKAQGQFAAAAKSRTNPHLKNTYATLDDIIDAVRAPLAANGLAFIQPLGMGAEGAYVLETLVLHESGEWIGAGAPVSAATGMRGVNDLQAFGAALTYMRRYMLIALLGINTEEDDDGNGKQERTAATAARSNGKAKRAKAAPRPTVDPLPPEEWGNIPSPDDYNELWSAEGQMWALIGYKDKRHAQNTVRGETFENAAAMWQHLVDHQRSKIEVPA
jgi:hypothetical protein